MMNKNVLTKKQEEMAENERKKSLVQEINLDFEKRQEERRPFDKQWQLNINFLMGNQYCSIGDFGEVEEYSKQFFWQEREVFNHIAPLIDVRLSKLSRVRPVMAVVPASNDENDLKTAQLTKKILKYVSNVKNLSDKIYNATKWSEVCGTSFYKIIWNSSLGKVLATKTSGEKITSGDVEIEVCSPFEIYPDNITSSGLKECKSVIHARAYPIKDIEDIWGVKVAGKDVNVFSLSNTNTLGGLGYNASAKKVTDSKKSEHAVVIERYTLPSSTQPNGRLEIICDESLLYEGDLPYINGENGTRGFPFVKQDAMEQTGCFWGSSIIERAIPIQRAYNAVKNRKHEFLNRISMGVLTVEDGSCDIENLEEEGLSPGKILVYRQGATPPSFMGSASVPSDFTLEEERLLNEFLLVSGVSDLMRNTSRFVENTSGVALQLMMEQDDSRIFSCAENIRCAIKHIGEQLLRLYKQFATIPRIAKVGGDGAEVEMFFFKKSDITSDEIIFETDNEISETLAQKRTMVFDLLKNGLLTDENGKLSNRMRVKVLELLGFGLWENAQDINELHIKKAEKENLDMLVKDCKCNVLEIDDHQLHIEKHTAFMLGNEFEKANEKDERVCEKFLNHIRKHKQMQKVISLIEEEKSE